MSFPICNNCPSYVTPPPSPCDANCIYAPNMLYDDKNVCDSTITLNISPIVTKCGTDPVSYSILHTENIKPGITINSTSIVYSPLNSSITTSKIRYKVSCGMLSDYGDIVIVYNNPCFNVNCQEYYKCDKCDGICKPLPNEIKIKNPILNEIRIK